MTVKPLVAIVGRPNVGKSTLFNKLVGSRISIVENTPGVTRDRLYADTEWCGKYFTLVDTGGLELKSQDTMWTHIKEQAQLAIDTADVIVYVVDGKTGLTLDDQEVASYLRKSDSNVILAVNKIDNMNDGNPYDFYALGFGEPFAVSAEQSKGLGDLLDKIVENFPDVDASEYADFLKIAIVGKPNAGKSSITNKLLGYSRVIVTDIPGTTRDAIDTELQVGDDRFTLIDTAGMRKKKSISEDLEHYSVLRALVAVRRADVALIICDANEGMTSQDIKIAGYVHEEGKPSIVVMNKWDLIEKDNNTVNIFKRKLQDDLKFMEYAKPLFVSAKNGQRITTILPYAKKVHENANKRITTGLLNEVLIDAIRISEPPAKNGRRLKIYFMTQVSVVPPTFVIKVNEPDLMHFSYKRYLENAIRKSFDFEGTPIRLLIRKNSEQ